MNLIALLVIIAVLAGGLAYFVTTGVAVAFLLVAVVALALISAGNGRLRF